MKLAFLFSIIIGSLLIPRTVLAADPQHLTLIINQVRGDECCDPGDFDNFQKQLNTLDSLNLKAGFAVRYDALVDQQYSTVLASSPHQLGGLLEITPLLAAAAGVAYKGDEQSWYEAQNVFLIGYQPNERKKLIDTYFQEFRKVFGYYPVFTTAWMIDAWSLQYLKTEYGVQLHQITREQFGTDSYTLYGGPMHYPYRPSKNWAMIPNATEQHMPVIVRQTIVDPIYGYGDVSDSYTSQPNDYLLRDDNTSYFEHLFFQAHSQPQDYTFALIGLENSMGENIQEEYARQLVVVKNWLEINPNSAVVSVGDVFSAVNKFQNSVQVYHGTAQNNTAEQAVWIQSDQYRVRLRLSDNELFLSDLRIYHPQFADPYIETPAGILGWWIIPYIIDGSRNLSVDTTHSTLGIRNDYLTNREEKYGEPQKITLATELNAKDFIIKREASLVSVYHQNNLLASFAQDQFNLNDVATQQLASHRSQFGNFWDLEQDDNAFRPVVYEKNLQAPRQEFSDQLFPQLEREFADDQNSELYVNNQYAIIGRNPIRLVLFPKDDQGRQVMLADLPKVSTNPSIASVDIKRPHGSNGMVFIDLDDSNPGQVEASVSSGYFVSSAKVTFVTDCKQKPLYCLTHPKNTWWYLMSKIEDRRKAREEVENKAEMFVD